MTKKTTTRMRPRPELEASTAPPPDTAQEFPQLPETMPPPVISEPGVYVVFMYVRHDGQSGTAAFHATGLPDIRNVNEMNAVVHAIRQSDPNYATVTVTNWKPLATLRPQLPAQEG